MSNQQTEIYNETIEELQDPDGFATLVNLQPIEYCWYCGDKVPQNALNDCLDDGRQFCSWDCINALNEGLCPLCGELMTANCNNANCQYVKPIIYLKER